MSILPTWPIAAGALVLGLVSGFTAEHWRLGSQIATLQRDHANESAQRDQVRAADERAARETENKLLQQAAFALEEKQNEINRIDARHTVAVDGLRQRAARPATRPGEVPATSPACQGGTGLGLSREDGEFLVREAAAAAAQQASLAQCYKAYDALMPGK